MTPRYRQERIAEVLAREEVRSQTDLARRLRAAGIRVSQATLSRDLQEMGVIRGPAGYSLPGTSQDAASPSGQPPERILREFVRSVAAAGSLAVVKTDPGHAHTLGVAIDQARWAEVVGTVAGDDTVFVAAGNEPSAGKIVQRIRAIVA